MAKFLDDRVTIAREINMISDIFLHQMIGDKSYSGFECKITRDRLLDLQQKYKFLYGAYYNGRD